MGSVCGILSKKRIDADVFKIMESQLAHRGKKTKEYHTPNLCFIERKHCTIQEKQKAFSKGSIFLIMDGEFYNTQLLKAQLQKKGIRFETDSDEEIIIKTYLKYGRKFINFLDGEFALALWDAKKKRLILVRDKIGIKPLYFYVSKDVFLFASEIKAMFKYPEFKKEINNRAISHFFSFFYYIPGTETIFKGVKKLNPSCFLIYEDNKIGIEKYWNIDFYQKTESESFFENNFLKNLENSVYKRIKNQTGILLSGGIDSSAIAAITKDHISERIKTFSAGFECENEFNELGYAREVAGYLETKHYEIIIKSEEIKDFQKIIWYLDDLNGSGSTAITAHKLLGLAKKKGCTQVFTGHEMELGTREFTHIEYLTKLGNNIPPILKRPIFSSLFKKYPKINKAMYILCNSHDIGKISSKLSSLFQEEELKKLLQIPPEPAYPLINELFNGVKVYSTFNKLRYVELKINLPNFNLIRYDRLGMANLIEVKFPFLDSEFVKFSASIPMNMSIKGNKEKIVLKKAFAGKLPQKILERKRHQGRPPLKLWVSEQQDYIFNNLSELSKRCYFKKDYINYLIKNYTKDKNYLKIWALFGFEMWYKTFMEPC